MENLSTSKPDPSGVFIHGSSYVDEGVAIGKGTRIWHFSHIMKGSVIGENCNIGQNVMIGPDVVIGNHVKIQNNVSIYKGVTLEDHVFCGPSCVFTNVINPRSEIVRKEEIRKTIVRRGATIGANATIVCGNQIGSYAFLGAGTVVVKDVPSYALILGVPGKVAGYMCVCGVRLKLNGATAVCGSCHQQYARQKGVIQRIQAADDPWP